MKILRLMPAFAMLSFANAHAATIEMTVNGLVCGFCAQGIEKTLRKKPATADVLVSLENRLVAVELDAGTDIADETLRTAITEAGYTVVAIKRSEEPLQAVRARIAAEAGDD